MAARDDTKKTASGTTTARHPTGVPDGAPDTTKSARTATDSTTTTPNPQNGNGNGNGTPSTTTTAKPDPEDVSAKEGEAGKDPMQSGALSTSGPDTIAVVEPGTDELEDTPTGSPPGVHVFPEHTSVEPSDAGEYKADLADLSEHEILASIFAVIRNELGADKPFLRNQLDALIGMYTGIDRSTQATQETTTAAEKKDA
jgi:hypothetical protein